jgi:hypothetical protein
MKTSGHRGSIAPGSAGEREIPSPLEVLWKCRLKAQAARFDGMFETQAPRVECGSLHPQCRSAAVEIVRYQGKACVCQVNANLVGSSRVQTAMDSTDAGRAKQPMDIGSRRFAGAHHGHAQA